MTTESSCEKARMYVERHAADHLSGRMKYFDGPCITISRETGAGANFVCDELMQLFEEKYPEGDCPWAVFEKNIIDMVIEDHNLPGKIKEYLGEQTYATMNTVMKEILGLHPPLITLHRQTTETILKLAYIGNCIIVGRGANLITARLKKAVHIRLIASYEHRLEHMKQHYTMDTKTAEQFIKEEDTKRRKYIETYFHKSAEDPHSYDLVINTGKISFAGAAKIIAAYVEMRQPATVQS